MVQIFVGKAKIKPDRRIMGLLFQMAKIKRDLLCKREFLYRVPVGYNGIPTS